MLLFSPNPEDFQDPGLLCSCPILGYLRASSRKDSTLFGLIMFNISIYILKYIHETSCPLLARRIEYYCDNNNNKLLIFKMI